MRSQIFVFSFFIFCFCALQSTAQGVITLQNPSFEDMPRRGGEHSPPIMAWHDCAIARFPGETPPDIHPVPYKAWEVTKTAYDGLTYLGMVTRYNDTYESLSQALSSPIQGGKCYSFSAFIAKSQLYKSPTTKRLDTIENFDRPIVMRIWGGNSFCHKGELLGETPAVNNFEWMHYKFLMQPKGTHKYFTIEAFYKTPILEAYNGHILIDKLSDIVPVACPLFPQNLVAKVSTPPAMVENKPSSGSTASNTTTKPKPGTTTKPGSSTPATTTNTFKAELLPELDVKKVFVGQKIRINHLYFKADSVNLLPGSHKVLNELAAFLKAYPKTIIEIGGHTNTIPPDDYCNKLSTARAKAVQDYLISQGVPDYRLEYKGYGKTDPLIPYDKYNKEARFKNQRVEIKILSLS